jgi:hypothetical protein
MTTTTRVAFLALFLLAGCDPIYDEETLSQLSDLTLSAGQLVPPFSPAVRSYAALVGEDIDSITVTATASDSYAELWVNDVDLGGDQGSALVPLALGNNTIRVDVKWWVYAGYETRSYYLYVTRQPGSWSVGGTVTGLTGVLSLQNNGGDDLVLTDDGPFAFAVPLPDGDSYDVVISAQPPGQTCSVSGAQGAVKGAAISNIAVDCVDTLQVTF